MRLSWNTGERPYHSGIDRVVLYSEEGGFVWNGVTAIDEKSNSVPKPRYIDGNLIGSGMSPEGFGFTLQAFTYPKEFEPYDGFQTIAFGQRRKSFDLSYRTLVQNNHYLIHLVYNVLASPTDRSFKSINGSTDPSDFSWECSTKPEIMNHARPAAHLILDTRIAYSWVVEELENILYGAELTDARMPSPDEVWELVEAGSIFMVIDHGDHTFTFTGPDSIVSNIDVDEHLWQIGPWPSVVPIDSETYQISSL